MMRGGPAAVMALGLLTGCGTTPSAPSAASTPRTAVAVHAADEVKSALGDGRVTRPLVFDGGPLRLEPPDSGRPEPDEAKAIAVVRSSAPVGSASPGGLALVGLARAWLALPVTLPSAVTASPPRLAGRLVWMVLTTGGPHSCPTMTGTTLTGTTLTGTTLSGTTLSGTTLSGTAVPRPEPMHVDLVAADGSGLGVTYTTAGSFCGRPEQAAAAPLTYHVSLPWRLVSSTTRTITVSSEVPPCALAQGSMTSANLRKGTSTLGIDAVVFMTPDGCHVSGPGSGRSVTESVNRTGTGMPTPEPSGLNPTGMISYPMMNDFTYDDGTTHTIP